jgi:hypothetical protein
MENADTPPTQPSGFLVPPTKLPPTAVATADLPPPHPSRPEHYRTRRIGTRFIENVLDEVDKIADAIRSGLGLRDR